MAAEGLNPKPPEHYILAPQVATPERTCVLKRDEVLGVFNDFGDVDTDARHDEGLYFRGTRHLSRYVLQLAGARPLLLSSNLRQDNVLLGIDLTNPDIYLAGELVLPRGSLHIYRTKFAADDGCHERIHLRNFTAEPLDVVLVLEFGADWRDIFEVRGSTRARRGEALPGRIANDAVELGYCGLDGIERSTIVRCSPPPRHFAAGSLRLDARLDGRSEKVFSISIECRTGSVTPAAAATPLRLDAAREFDRALSEAERQQLDAARFACGIGSSHAGLNAWINRSAADIALLLTRTPQGLYPYAGVPWFDAPFGRDGLITALECLWLAPRMARDVLAFLAATQARESEPARDAEPGKILHEMRNGEMAAVGEVPFERYYGSVDSTPLFVLLAGAYLRRTGDLEFVRGIAPNVQAALRWMAGPGDSDGDGFIEYERRSTNGLVNQGWKDSNDSICHADGTLAAGSIALCEVQAYAYAAWVAGAEIGAALGDPQGEADCRRRAVELRRRFVEQFWSEELGLPVLALDGRKQPCRVRTSNAGHALFTGILDVERAARIAAVLQSETLFSGWGVRTLADRELRYNPMAYHNGSIWPHDNALIALGLRDLPDKTLALRILGAQLEAAGFFDGSRLPELFCGFRRRRGKAPTLYPVACSPQAWAAGAVFGLLQACLGLSVEAAQRRIVFRYPQLPEGVERLHIRGLAIGEASVDLTLYRYSGAIGIDVERRTGRIDVAMIS